MDVPVVHVPSKELTDFGSKSQGSLAIFLLKRQGSISLSPQADAFQHFYIRKSMKYMY